MRLTTTAMFFLAVLFSDSAMAQFPFVKYSDNPVLLKGNILNGILLPTRILS